MQGVILTGVGGMWNVLDWEEWMSVSLEEPIECHVGSKVMSGAAARREVNGSSTWEFVWNSYCLLSPCDHLLENTMMQIMTMDCEIL
jgi:hypothetical protein